MANFFQRLFKKIPGDGIDRFSNLSSEVLIPAELSGNYASILSRVIPYFNQLNESNKQKFLDRVYNFRKIKSFHFHGMNAADEVEILVSAAAVQVSFGLKNYLLPFFKDIHILADAYQASIQKKRISGMWPRQVFIFRGNIL